MPHTKIWEAVEIYGNNGQEHGYIWDANSVASMLATQRAIRQARHTRGTGITKDMEERATEYVRCITLQHVGPLRAFYQLFCTPADHDAAIQELTEEGNA